MYSEAGAQPKMTVGETELVRSVCMESFYEFVREFWEFVVPEKPVWNWHIPYLCAVRQATAERVFKGKKRKHHIIVNVPPGTTKSTIFSIMFPAWVWTRMPSARFISVCHTLPLARTMAIKCRDIVKSEKYQACFPWAQIRPEQDAKDFFMTTKGGMRFSIGTGGSIIGHHAHFLDVDDPIDPEGTNSKDELEIAGRYISETLMQRMVNKEVSVFSMVMQRLAENDPTGFLLDRDSSKGNFKHYCLPGELTDEIKPPYLAQNYKDGLLDPVRLSRKILKDMFDNLLDYGYACQVLQTPIPRDGAKFQVEKIAIEEPPPIKYGFKQIIRYWDKAATGGGGAFTVGLLMGRDHHDRYWILDVIRVQYEPHRRDLLIKQTDRIDPPHVVYWVEQEPGSGGLESAQATVRMLPGRVVHLERPHGKKEARADAFMSQVNGGNVLMAPGIWNEAYISELRFFPRGRYKDQVDASCLVGDTLVDTARGLVPIKDVVAGDRVLTRLGYKRVVWSGCTGHVENLVKVEFSNGSVLVGTENHPVLTQERGFVKLGELGLQDTLYTGGLWWQKRQNANTKLLSSMAFLTGDYSQMGCTMLGKVGRECYIKQSGVRLTEIFLKGVSFITKMRTPSTMIYQTLNVSQGQSMVKGMRNYGEPQNNWPYLPKGGLGLRNGMHRQMVLHGTSSTAKKLGRGANQHHTNVNFVAGCFSLGGQELSSAEPNVQIKIDTEQAGEISPRFVPGVVLSLRGRSGESFVQDPVLHYKGTKTAVYNLMIEDVPEFFANGVLVHNSGSFNQLVTPNIVCGAI